jgi:hypothetical protein
MREATRHPILLFLLTGVTASGSSAVLSHEAVARLHSPDNADKFDVTFNARIITSVKREKEDEVTITLNDEKGTKVSARRVADTGIVEIVVTKDGQRLVCCMRLEVFATIVPQPEKFPKSDDLTTGLTLKDVKTSQSQKSPQKAVFATPIVMVLRGADDVLTSKGGGQVFTKYHLAIERATPVNTEPKKPKNATTNLPQFDETPKLTGDVLKKISDEDKSWVYIDAPAVANVYVLKGLEDVGYLLTAQKESGEGR